LMPQLDRWIVRHALKRLAQGVAIPRLSINLSGQTIVDAEFPAFVAAQIRESGVAPDAIVFEIDETDVIERIQAVAAFSAAVKPQGCRLLFDGFGRRSISFAPLKSLRFDYVKVDGAIVRQIRRSAVAAAKMNAVGRVGETIGVGVIAECIEDPETLAAVKATGTHYAQGFGIALPQPVASISRSDGPRR